MQFHLLNVSLRTLTDAHTRTKVFKIRRQRFRIFTEKSLMLAIIKFHCFTIFLAVFIQSIKMDFFGWRMSKKSESEAPMDGCQWRGM